MSASVIFPVDYSELTDLVMESHTNKNIQHVGLEEYGHPVVKNQKTEFNEKRGDFITVYGWRLFWDKVGTYQPYYLYNRGYLYDAENGLGYVGKMVTVNGEPHPSICRWAASRFRLKHPTKGIYGIDKTDAIYEYESLDMY